MGFKFEKLRVWKKSIELANEIHMMTRQWPKEEVYVLTSQINRGTDSISLNITEGSTGQTNAEFKRFLTYVNRSALEVVNCLYLSKGRQLIDEGVFIAYYNKLTEIIKMLRALKKSIK